MGDDPARLYRLDGVAHIAGVINDEETFGECPEGADEETVQRFARAYIMMLLGTQLFADKFRPAGYDTCSWPLASRWSGYSPSYSEKGPRVQNTRLKIDMLQPRNVSFVPVTFI
ncbi:hypothetical protein Ahy_B01g052268 [Arachis hypogaea]|uniref:Uncharacterized protein n=1 Tax=Arachis hypogaea TaxID=3818 RepID=A0A445ANY4_ARAHY|nr:hypothetical protein Ahy_B01g052268 [Arachis hypogaea]